MLLTLLFRLPALLFDTDPGSGGGNGGDPPPATPPASSPPANPPAPDPGVQQAMQNLIDRHNNDLRSVIQTLFTENYGYRDNIRDLKAQLKDLKAQTPGQGQVVVSQEEADALAKYREIGDVETVTKLQGELNQAREQLGALQREGILRDVADVTGYKLPVLKRLAGDDLVFEIRDVEKDGQTQKAVFVKNGDNDPVALADYAQANWADFLPALQAQAAPPAGTPYPNQDAGRGAPPKPNLVGDFIKESREARAKQTNPLLQ